MLFAWIFCFCPTFKPDHYARCLLAFKATSNDAYNMALTCSSTFDDLSLTTEKESTSLRTPDLLCPSKCDDSTSTISVGDFSEFWVNPVLSSFASHNSKPVDAVCPLSQSGQQSSFSLDQFNALCNSTFGNESGFNLHDNSSESLVTASAIESHSLANWNEDSNCSNGTFLSVGGPTSPNPSSSVSANVPNSSCSDTDVDEDGRGNFNLFDQFRLPVSNPKCTCVRPMMPTFPIAGSFQPNPFVHAVPLPFNTCRNAYSVFQCVNNCIQNPSLYASEAATIANRNLHAAGRPSTVVNPPQLLHQSAPFWYPSPALHPNPQLGGGMAAPIPATGQPIGPLHLHQNLVPQFCCPQNLIASQLNGSTDMRRLNTQNEPKKTDQNRPFVCLLCSSTFTRKASLLRHQRTHTGHRPHQCDVCGNRFGDSQTLKIHRRIHTGEKPYTCHACSRTFRQQSTMKRHTAIHFRSSIWTPTECVM